MVKMFLKSALDFQATLRGEEGVNITTLRHLAGEVQQPQLLALFEPEVHEPQRRGAILHVAQREQAPGLSEPGPPRLRGSCRHVCW